MGFFSNIYDRASDIFGKLKDKAVQTFHNIKNTIYERGTTLLTGTHYVGPFNALDDEYIRTHPPTDKIDEGGLQHDRDYSHIAKLRDSGHVSQKEAQKLIRDSDLRFLSHMKDNMSANPWAGTLGYAGIKAKNILEDFGVIDPNRFVTMKIGGKVI